jgi:hypothetical protein
MKKWNAGLIALLFCTQLLAQDLTQIKKEQPFRWTGGLKRSCSVLSKWANTTVQMQRSRQVFLPG